MGAGFLSLGVQIWELNRGSVSDSQLAMQLESCLSRPEKTVLKLLSKNCHGTEMMGYRRRTWQPTPVFLPRESCGQRSLVGCCPWGRTESDTTEVTQHACMRCRRKWQPTQVFLPEESQERRSLVGCHLWGLTESDKTEATQQRQVSIFGSNSSNLSIFGAGNNLSFHKFKPQ